MKILYAASEALPFIASGGLADVAGSLPKALQKEGVECRVVLPLYSGIKPALREKQLIICHPLQRPPLLAQPVLRPL